MSNKSKKNEPELKTIGQINPIGKGIKVTGANLGKILHLISLDAEHIESETSVAISFEADGQLGAVTVFQRGQKFPMKRGDWVVKGSIGIYTVDGEEFDKLGLVAA
ncbi:hypothetical protein PBI_MRMAGOO_55 [Mycobacterium phage MrMagoo]|uniref:Uncharacterized protein n=1 Tax=Mycobacterium phage MrMagoo TaxID=1927020 RepID=A0A1L6BYJ2_9CAUD|nr:hypothetical protein J4U04_gp055 [Mycobacterium phage MrMagoo]APQ42159.1 hypothetical protein PBI_MRMAGOO_55 [Mycobacterium phage MrMagoo]ARM70235.1 hypothetical protein SEA_GARDENSALSA_55 [Mycobacterium phage GardenSalsa]